MSLSSSSLSQREIALEKNIRPQDNFDAFVNSLWRARNPIPDGHKEWSTITQLREKVKEDMNHIIENELYEYQLKDKLAKQILNFWISAKNEGVNESSGKNPILSICKLIDTHVAHRSTILPMIATLTRYGLSSVFNLRTTNDEQDSKTMSIYLYESGIGMHGSHDYENKDTLKAYCIHIAKQWRELHRVTATAIDDGGGGGAAAKSSTCSKEQAIDVATKIVELEREMAMTKMTKTEERDACSYNRYYIPHATHEGGYGSKTLEGGDEEEEEGNMESFFTTLLHGIEEGKRPEYVVIDNPEFVERLQSDWIPRFPVEVWRDYLKWSVIRFCAPYSSRRLRTENFNFFSKHMHGVRDSHCAPLSNRFVYVLTTYMKDALGKYYTKTHFTEESKRDLESTYCEPIRSSMRKHLEGADWMTDRTKRRAVGKLANFKIRIGYPEVWEDYSDLAFDPSAPFLENVLRAANSFMDRQFFYFREGYNEKRWYSGAAHEVNAIFCPTRNEIVIPAAILQPPFYDPLGDVAMNFGAIGGVIAHEITHGYDDVGKRYDEHGNLSKWWLDADERAFGERKRVIVEQYSSCFMGDADSFVNGELTAGENIADVGGIKIAFDAFKMYLEGQKKKKQQSKTTKNLLLRQGPQPSSSSFEQQQQHQKPQKRWERKIQERREREYAQFTDEQKFFMSWAFSHRGKMTPESLKRSINTKCHAPFMLRVNMPMSNTKGFYEAFDVKPEDQMYIRPSKRINIW